MRRAKPVRQAGGRLDHRHLLEIPEVRRWHAERKLRSEISADVYLRQLGLFLNRTGLDPSSLVKFAQRRPDELQDRLVALAAQFRCEGRLETYVAKVFDGVRSFLSHQRVPFKGFPKLRPVTGESIKNERIPTQDELRRVLPLLTSRGRVSALLMAQAGLRPGVLGDYRGVNGLVLGDIPELRLEPEPHLDLPSGRRSIMVRVPARLSKTSRAYVSFATLEAAEAILAFLAERRSRGETLSPESPLVSMTPLGTRAPHEKGVGSFVTTKSVELEIRRALKAACPRDTTWRPYVLRAFCSSAMLTARVDRDAREAMLGHSLGVSGRYNLSKRLSPRLIDMVRDEYERALEELLIERRSDTPNVDRLEKGLWSAVLESLGVETSEAERLATAGEERVKEAIRQRVRDGALRAGVGSTAGPAITLASSPPATGGRAPDQRRERLVSLEELDDWLSRGAEYVAPAGTDRVVVRFRP